MTKNPEKLGIQITYEQLYGRTLSEQELFNIKRNLVGFFNVLIKIDKQNKKKSDE